MASTTGDVDINRRRVMRINGIQVVLSASGSPTVGDYHAGDVCLDYGTPKVWMCTVTGSPGTWKGVVLS